MSEDTALQALFDGTLRNSSGNVTNALLVYGAPNTGKTQFAVRAAISGYKRWSHNVTAMAVQNRVLASKIDNIIIRQIGVSKQSRPVGTLASLAFTIISACCKLKNNPSPKLLNGAEQDSLLRKVLRAHIEHVMRGDNGDCNICALFKDYFETSQWVVPLTCAVSAASVPSAPSATPVAQSTSSSPEFLADRFDINNAFMHQLRDMLARLDELGISDFESENSVLRALSDEQSYANNSDILQTSVLIKRRLTQWRLAFALRAEYRKIIADTYKSSFRLDASQLLVEGAKSARELGEHGLVNSSEIPALLVVDDYQDITLAGLSFIETLSKIGTRLVLLANPDESVQSFRGAYPDYAISAALDELNAAEQTLEYTGFADSCENSSDDSADFSKNYSADPTFANYTQAPSMRELLASRVSLSLTSQYKTDVALPNRPWKMPKFVGSLPIEPIETLQNSNLNSDDTVFTALYRSQREELDAVIWQMKQSHVNNKRKWSDMALIAHDNSTVRLFGEQLRASGVPVRYSSVTRPLKDEPFVQGLFALIELAQFAQHGFSGIVEQVKHGRSLQNLASWVRLRVQNIMDSPLSAITKSDSGFYGNLDVEIPAKLYSVDSLMRSLSSLSAVLIEQNGEKNKNFESNAPLQNLVHNWDLLQNSLHDAQSKAYVESQILVDNSCIDGSSNDLMPLSLDACYLLCVADVARSIDDDSTVLQILQNMAPRNPHVAAFVKLWKNVQILASRMHNNPDLSNAQYALGEAWNICHVAERWQRMSLQHNSEGYRANDRLDAAMRLFDYVSSYVSSDISSMNTFDDTFRQENVVSIADFIAQVRGMEIEADSLAKVAPVPDAVTLTTPAGSVGKHWNLVWMPTLQQRVWPNLASRSTMFGAESLANIILHSKISASKLTVNASLLSNNDKSAVFASEQRSFLLAITRATERLYISAQYSDSAVPSDFLYYYLPERYYNNENSRTPFTEFTTPFAGLDMDARGLVCAARSQILRASSMKEEFGNSACSADNAGNASSPDIANSSNSENSKSRNAIIDAAQTLQLLKENGVFCADPFEWDFMSDIDDYVDKKSSVEKDNEKNNEKAGSAKKASSVVSLSPSAVDSLWACPVCGLLNRQLLGPQPGSAATYFGTLIHETARWASENQHYDMPETEVDETETANNSAEVANNSADYSPYSPLVRRSNAIANLMEKYYLSIAPELADIRDSKEHYSALAREKNIKRALHAIAQYFVTSYDQSTYALNSKKSENGILESLTKSEKSLESSIGRLQQAYCELQTSAHFGFNDIARVLNNTFKNANLQTVTTHDCYELMGALVGGWPDGASEDMQVHIHGRIDRMEKRINSDGSEHIRLLDYKTGKPLTASGVFNDLQLVCYQLALLFSDENPLIDASNAPIISRSILFHVAKNDYPAQDHNVAENVYQPPLCVKNAFNNNPLELRVGFKNMARLLDCPHLDDIAKNCPENVSESAWQSFTSLNQSAKWSLTMISRVCYAAAAVRSHKIIAHPTSEHLKYCNGKQVCPACAGCIDTVYEVL